MGKRALNFVMVVTGMTMLLLLPVASRAQTASTQRMEYPGTSAAVRDGQHDFDPLLGNWKYHLKRLLNPLSSSKVWVDYDGSGVCSAIWNGRGELDQAEFHTAKDRIEGLVVRTYDPQTHQWRLNWANVKNGIFDPPQIGQFKDGRGEFFAHDTLNGKNIFVRFEWTRLDTDTPHFEQAFSDDDGKTWEVNWITDQTRMP